MSFRIADILKTEFLHKTNEKRSDADDEAQTISEIFKGNEESEKNELLDKISFQRICDFSKMQEINNSIHSLYPGFNFFGNPECLLRNNVVEYPNQSFGRYCGSYFSSITDSTNPLYPNSRQGAPPSAHHAHFNCTAVYKNLSLYNHYSKRRNQVRFSTNQTKLLENKFSTQKYLSPEDRKVLAHTLKLSDRQVKTWFQNRRAKWRRNSSHSD